MKYLIINADDFGYSEGINRGIIEAHKEGILTSTSLMVDEPAARKASILNDYKDLSVGLHFVALGMEGDELEGEFRRQLAKFKELMKREPDHIDTHKIRPNADSSIRDLLAKYSKEHKTPIRSFGHANFIESFFGLNIDGSGLIDEGKVSIEGFKKALQEVKEGYNELMCHVGYSDDYLRSHSSYNDIREIELSTLKSNESKNLIESMGITLCSWRQVEI